MKQSGEMIGRCVLVLVRVRVRACVCVVVCHVPGAEEKAVEQPGLVGHENHECARFGEQQILLRVTHQSAQLRVDKHVPSLQRSDEMFWVSVIS